MSPFGSFSDDCRRIRLESPVVHNITNYVAMSLSANALLAVGASPLMSSEPGEMEEISSVCNSLVINIGCLERLQAEAMRKAASAMSSLGKPWVLDPAGAGLSRMRTETAVGLISAFKPAVIRGNASEIMVLDGAGARSRGLDSSEDGNAAASHAVSLAQKYGTVVSVSGPVDLITDGRRMARVANGSPLMASVTAMGCTASALVAAFLAVDKDPFSAAACAMALMGVAGELASRSCAGTGSFAVSFIDVLSTVDPAVASSMIRYE